MRVTWRKLRASALIAAMALAPLPAAAQDYPSRPVTLVVPFPPGGSTTIVGRIVADKLGEVLGQQIVIDNRAGAGGTVGTRAVAKAAPDGYTLVLGYTGTLAIGPSLYPNVGYDPRKDFAPIGRIGTAPNTLVVHPSFPAKTSRRTDQPLPRPIPARSTTAPPASAPSVTSAANTSRPRPASSSRTFPTRAPDRWSPICSAVTSRWRSRRFRRPTKTPRAAICACWR